MPRAERRPELSVLPGMRPASAVVALVAATAEAVSRWEAIALFVRVLYVFIVWLILLP